MICEPEDIYGHCDICGQGIMWGEQSQPFGDDGEKYHYECQHNAAVDALREKARDKAQEAACESMAARYDHDNGGD